MAVCGGNWTSQNSHCPCLTNDDVVWQAGGEPSCFCAANNGFILQNKVSSRGSTCSPATVTQSRWTQARRNALSNLIGRDQEPGSEAEISTAFVIIV